MRVKAGQRGSPLADSMQPQDKPNLHYPKMKYHWTKDPAIVNNADDGAALGGGWADTPAAFAAYSGPRPPRTAEQTPIKWVDDWTVPGVTSDHRQRIKIELLRADVAFWKSPDTPDAHHTATRLAFEGVAMVLFAAGILTENLLRNEIPQGRSSVCFFGGPLLFALSLLARLILNECYFRHGYDLAECHV